MVYSQRGSSVHGHSPGKNTGVGCHALFQGIFPTQGLNPDLPHCSRFFIIWATREAHANKDSGIKNREVVYNFSPWYPPSGLGGLSLWHFWDSSVSSHVAVVCSFPLLYSTPWFEYTAVHLPIILLMDILCGFQEISCYNHSCTPFLVHIRTWCKFIFVLWRNQTLNGDSFVGL